MNRWVWILLVALIGASVVIGLLVFNPSKIHHGRLAEAFWSALFSGDASQLRTSNIQIGGMEM